MSDWTLAVAQLQETLASCTVRRSVTVGEIRTGQPHMYPISVLRTFQKHLSSVGLDIFTQMRLPQLSKRAIWPDGDTLR